MSARDEGRRRGSGDDGGRDRRGPAGRGPRERGAGPHRERGQEGRARRPDRSAQAPRERRRTADPARAVAFEVLREVAESDAYANLVLPPLLHARRLRGRDAGFATELTYGTLRLRGRYDAVVGLAADRPADSIDPPLLDVLRLGVHQLLGMRVPPHAAVSETVALARERVGTGPAQLVNAVLRRVAADDLDTWLDRVGAAAGEDATARAAAVHSHPAWVVRALRQSLAADGRAAELMSLLEADNAAPAVTLVARPGLAERDAVLGAVPDARPGRWTPTAVVLPGGDPHDVPGVQQARTGVQDEGSQLVALALAAVDPVQPGERWLDMCAGPGGKSALLGALLAEHDGTLVANEAAAAPRRLVERSVAAVPPGVVEVRTGDGRAFGTDEPGTYDRVLVDAPCTGLGALRRRPEARWRRSPADLPALTALQRELLTAAVEATRPGGVVAYVTCSPHLAETLVVVDDVLHGRDDVERLDAREAARAVAGPDIPLGEGPSVQLWPHVHGTDAMFLTLLRRR